MTQDTKPRIIVPRPPAPTGIDLIGCTYTSGRLSGRVVGHEHYHGTERILVATEPPAPTSWTWTPVPSGAEAV